MKKKIEIMLIIGLFFYAFSGCVMERQKDNLTELNETNIKNEDNINFTEIADSSIYVRLEGRKGCFIGDIEDIQYVNSKFFILNDIEGENEVLVFDKSGKFLNKIGELGAGPGEYIAISAMAVNPFLKYIILMDPMKKELHKYDYSGKHIESLSLKEECGYMQKVRFISENKILFVNNINSVTSTLIAESDEDLDKMNILLKTKFSFGGGFKFATNPVSNQGNYFIAPLSDIIYNFDGGELQPAYSFNLNSTYHPTKELKKRKDFDKLFMDVFKKGYFPLKSVVESDDFLLIQQYGYSVLWNKKNKNGFNLKDGTKPLRNSLPVSSNIIISGFKNGFLVCYSPTDLISFSNYYDNEGMQPSKEIEFFIKDVSIEDNPYICIYMFGN